MKKYIRMAAMAVTLALLVTGCEKDPDEKLKKEFMQKSEMGVYGESSTIFAFDEQTCQYAVSSTAPSTRLQSDDMKKVVSITFSGQPTVNKTIDVQIKATGMPNSMKLGSEATVLKENDGKIWLMDEKNKICYVMPWD